MKTSDLFEAAVAYLVEHDEWQGMIYWPCFCAIEDAAGDLNVSDEQEFYAEDMFEAMYGGSCTTSSSYWWGVPCAETLQERVIALTFAAEYMRRCGD